MISSNSGIDFISLARASGVDPEAIMQEPEFAEYMRGYLSENTATVTFTKKDGTTRVMRCTRDSNLIPSEKLAKEDPNKPAKVPTGDAVQAFDLDIGEWRAFNTGNITRIEWAQL
jgi:hypothetical protein